MRFRFAFTLFLLLSLAPTEAALASDPLTAAQTAFDEGRRLEDAGDFAGAVERFEESERLDPALGTLLNLANCYERAGRLASAWRMFTRGATEAAALGESKRAQRAIERAGALVSRLSTLVIRIEGDDVAPDEEVRVDGARIDRSQWGTPQVIDGGSHVVEAVAPGRSEWSGKLSTANEWDRAVVTIPGLMPAPPEASPAAPSVAPKPVEAVEAAPAVVRPPPVESEKKMAWTPARIAAATAAGVGVVLLGVGVGYGLEARARWNARQDDCAYNFCTDAGYTLTAQARDAANVSTVAFVGAGAALAAAGALFVFSPSGGKGTTLAGEVLPGGAALRLRHTF
jgi:hypothetical protein